MKSDKVFSQDRGKLNVLVNNAAPMQISGRTGHLFEDVPLTNLESMLQRTLKGVADQWADYGRGRSHYGRKVIPASILAE